MFGKAQCTSKGHFWYFCGLICLVCTICFPSYQMVQILQHRSAVFFRSLSFVTCMGCMSFVLLGLMYFIVDVKEWWGGQPFIYPGMRIHLFKGIVCPKIKYLLKMDLPSDHPNCAWVCFFIQKFCIASLAHQWILCSEWVPSEWESEQLIKTSQ